jgi:hypothetical protein
MKSVSSQGFLFFLLFISVGCANEKQLQDTSNPSVTTRSEDAAGDMDANDELGLASAFAPKVQRSVAAAYVGILGRNPDAKGAEFWLKKLQSGEVSPVIVYQAMYDSPEYQGKSGLPSKGSELYLSRVAFFVYYHAFGRNPTAQEQDFWVKQAASFSTNREGELFQSMILGASGNDKLTLNQKIIAARKVLPVK